MLQNWPSAFENWLGRFCEIVLKSAFVCSFSQFSVLLILEQDLRFCQILTILPNLKNLGRNTGYDCHNSYFSKKA